MANIVTIDGIPVYQALADEEGCGMLRISLVDNPAVESNFLTFAKQRRPIMYAVQDEEKRLVLGVVMRADFPIYRRDEQDGKKVEYYIVYKADTIRTMAEKYLAQNRQNLVNLMHENGTDQEGIQMVQYFIKGNGIAPDGFDDISDGSLFAEFHVTNEEVWNAIKDGTYKGFSLEGVFDLKPEEDKGFVEEIVDSLDGIFSRIFKHQKRYEKMKKKGLLARLAKALVEMGNITTDKGILAWDGEEDLKAGDAVYIEDEEGNRTAAPDGDYVTEDKKTIVVVDGKVSEINDPAAEIAPSVSTEAVKAIETDKGKLEWDNEDEDLKEGDAVYVTDEEGNRKPAADGEYTTEDGKVITVVDGKVASITDPKAEVAADQKFARVAQALQESFNEKERKLYDAIMALGFSYPWIIEAGEDFVIACVWGETEGDVYYRFNVREWTEEGKPVLENGIKVVPAYITPEEKEAAEENLRAVTLAKETAENRVAELEARVAELSRKPAAMQAHEELGGGEVTKTGNKGLDRLNELLKK